MCALVCVFAYILIIQDAEVGNVQNCNTIEFLKFIPTITCCSPKDAISHIQPKKGKVIVL